MTTPRVLPIALIVGLIAGLLVGGFHNLFTVPVMEWAIVLEEERAAAEAPAAGAQEEDEGGVSLGVQRIGMVIGLGILGAIFGLIFAGLYHLVRGTAAGWPPLATSLVAGALGFWSLALFPYIRYPLNPPGVGDPETLLFRQGFQFLFIVLSAIGVVAAVYAVRLINRTMANSSPRNLGYAVVALAYAVFALLIVYLIPGNPDEVPVPPELLIIFRMLSVAGLFLFWLVLALGVGSKIMWYQRSAATADR